VSAAGPLLDTAFVTVYPPLSKPLSFLVLELVVLVSAGLGLAHARRALRAGDRGPLFTWIAIFVYGITMELLAYNFVKNFAHGQFTVMFYGRQLPLYVTAIYPVLLYTAIATAGRLGLSRWAEPFVAGLLIVAMDAPFDILGPVAGWWQWFDTDPNVAYRWLDVPVTSYYWHFAFGGILAALCRAVRPYLVKPARFALALPVAALTIVLGVVAFLPFHGLKALGVSDGAVVAALLAVGAAVALFAKKGRPEGRDGLLLATLVLFYGAHLAVAVGIAAHGAPGFRVKLGAVIAVTALAALAHASAHREVRTVAGAPST
jgi:hypothetical protein